MGFKFTATVLGVLACSTRAIGATHDVSASQMIEEHSAEIPQSLFYAASRASGYWLCDKRLKGSQARIFDNRYGTRFTRLAAAIELKDGLGWQPGDIIISICRRQTRAQRAKSLQDFGRHLDGLERVYLPRG